MKWTEVAYAISALGFQTLLLGYFLVRYWRSDLATRWGWIVYLLSVPAALLSLALIAADAPWAFAAAGLLYLIWAVVGYYADFVSEVGWRSPVRWPVFVPYVLLYLATAMFYWWPLARVDRRLWIVAAVAFALSSVFNLLSHYRSAPHSRRASARSRPG